MKSKRAKKDKQQPVQNQPAQPVAPIVNKLKTQDPNDRAWAATAISHLIQDTDSRLSLMQAKVVTQLVNTIQDENERVVLESLGALRNVLVSVGQDACVEAMDLQAVELLLQLLHRFIEMTRGPERDDEQPDLYLMLEQCIACLWSLAEYSENALSKVTSRDMLDLLMNLYTGNVKLSLKRISGQFLNTITDDNNDIYPLFLNQMDYSKQLVAILQNPEYQTWEDSKIELAITSASILNNIKVIFDENMKMEMYQSVLAILGEPLNFDINGILSAVQEAGIKADQSIQSATPNELTLNMGDLDLVTPKSKNTEYLDSVNSQLGVLQLILELLTNMYCEEVPEWDDAMDEEVVEDGDFVDEQMEQDESMKPFAALLFQGSQPLFSKIVKFCSLSLVKLEPAACQAFNIQLQQVNIRALAFASNLFLLGLVDPWIQDKQELKTFWDGLFDILVQSAKLNPVPLELFEGVVSLLFAISKSPSISIIPTQDQVHFLLEAASQQLGAPESIKFKIVGILSLFARIQGHVELNQIIGEWIMNQLVTLSSIQGNTGSAVIAELLNSIYDIYSDKSFDYDHPVYVAKGFNNILQQQLPLIQTKFKQIEKKQRDLREMCSEAVTNLKAFIQYKQSE